MQIYLISHNTENHHFLDGFKPDLVGHTFSDIKLDVEGGLHIALRFVAPTATKTVWKQRYPMESIEIAIQIIYSISMYLGKPVLAVEYPNGTNGMSLTFENGTFRFW